MKDYLLGGNEQLIGTVLAIRKGLKKSNFDKYMQAVQEDPNNKHFIPEGYAVMLYFDHRLARIVRHLFNPNLTFWGKTPELADFTTIESRYKSLPKKNPYLYNYDLELKDQTPIIAIEQIDVKHSPNVPAVVPKTFFDGKINSRMITAFFYHLYSNWLMKGQVYDTTDFLSILQNTDPVGIHKDGVFQYADDNELISNSNIKELEVSPVIDYPESGEVYIPKGLSVHFSSMFSDIRFVHKTIDESPQVIHDLKSVINTTTIQNNKNLIKNINKFNEAIQLKLAKMSNTK